MVTVMKKFFIVRKSTYIGLNFCMKIITLGQRVEPRRTACKNAKMKKNCQKMAEIRDFEPRFQAN